MNSPVDSNPAPLLTVLLPVRNGEATLACALTSLLHQTFRDFEIIVLDDGSTDNSASIAARLGDQRIRVVSDGVQRGLVSRLNEGVVLARGSYIARMDADDVSFQQRFETQIAFLDAHPEVDLLGCRAVAFCNGGSVVGLLPFAATHEELCARPWRNIPLPHPGWMGRVAWFRANPYRTPEIFRAEDQELLLRASQHSRYSCLDEVLLGYRQGAFDLERTLKARTALWAAQCRIFFERGQSLNLLLASAVSVIKVVIDLLATLPGTRRLWFFRMSGPVCSQVRESLRATLELCDDRVTNATLVGSESDMNRKLLFFVTEDWFFCSHFLARAKAAVQAGFDVAVLTRVNQHATTIENSGIRVIPLKLDRGGANPFREIALIARVISAYRDEQPDIVHHVALKPVIYGSFAARWLRIRRVINAPVGMGYVFSSDSVKAGLLRPLVRILLKWLLQPFNGKVVFENYDDLQAHVRGGAVDADHAVLIRGAGVDVNHFKPIQPPEGTVVITLAARMIRDKGVEEFVQAAHLLRKRGLVAIFRLVGAVDQGNPASLNEAKLQKWNSDGLVQWLGHSDDMASTLSSTHIACLPSYREGLPKSLLEALASGLPVVTTDVQGCRETVRHGVNGLLVPAKNSIALADALEVLIRDEKLRTSYGLQSRLRAVAEFSNEIITFQTLAVYQSLVDQA